MLKLFLNTQFRNRLFIIPLIFLPLAIYANSYIIVIFFLQNRFTNVFRNSDFHLDLFHITGKGLSRYLQTYNLSWAIWFNLWFIISRMVDVLLIKNEIRTALIDLINFNIVLFISFVIGNLLSNSDMITISRSFVRIIGASFVFSVAVSAVYALLYGITLLNIPMVNILLLLLSIVGWQYSLRQQVEITYIQYYYD